MQGLLAHPSSVGEDVGAAEGAVGAPLGAAVGIGGEHSSGFGAMT